MDTRANGAPAELPLACTLGADDGPARMRRWQALAKKGRPNARRSPSAPDDVAPIAALFGAD